MTSIVLNLSRSMVSSPLNSRVFVLIFLGVAWGSHGYWNGMSLHLKHTVTRRRMMQRILTIGIGIPLAGALIGMLRKVQSRQAPRNVNIPPDVATGLTIMDSIVVHRTNDGSIHAFSGFCTHLGCRLDRIVGDEIVCPCHGSRYRGDGTVAAGPAGRPLVALKVDPDPSSGGWIARASA